MVSLKVGFHSLNGKYVVLLILQIPRVGCSEGYLFQDVTLIIESRTQCPLWCARPLQLLSLPLQSLISPIQKAAALECVTQQLMLEITAIGFSRISYVIIMDQNFALF